MVFFGFGMNSGERGGHSPKKLPLLVVGGDAGGLKYGQHIAHDPKKYPPLANFLHTITQEMVVETGGFSDSTDTLADLA